MLNCQQAQDLFSGYFDGTLDAEHRAALSHHICSCPECADEYRDFARTLEVVRVMPDEEPTIDLWPEFVTKLEEVEAEQKLGLRERLRRSWLIAIARVSEGAILYTSQLAHRTNLKFGKYVISDPFAADD